MDGDDSMKYVFVFILCACITSNLNCIVYRVPRGLNFVTGRSMCESCGHHLLWLDLIPILSCVMLRARCCYCGEYFGWFHCISEIVLATVGCVLYALIGHLYIYLVAIFVVFLVYFSMMICLECFCMKR